MAEKFTTLKVSKKLTEKLKEIGSKSETYEDIIWRLIENTSDENRVNPEGMEKLSARIEALTAKFKNLESTRIQKK